MTEQAKISLKNANFATMLRFSEVADEITRFAKDAERVRSEATLLIALCGDNPSSASDIVIALDKLTREIEGHRARLSTICDDICNTRAKIDALNDKQ